MQPLADRSPAMIVPCIRSAGHRTQSLPSILAALDNDPQENRGRPYRVVATHEPSLCLFHLLAGWRAGQIVVFAGSIETAADMLGTEDALIAEDVIIGDSSTAPAYTDLVFPSQPDAPAAVVMSSGTTGKPKGILLTRAGIEASADLLIDVFKLEPGETYGNLSPVHTMGGLRAFMLALRYGNDIQFFEGVEARDLAFAKHVLSSGVAVVLSGASFVRLLDLSSRWLAGERTALRAIMSCGSLYDDRASRAVRDAYGIEVVNAYGQTETAGIVMCEPLGVYRPGLMAPPLPGVRQHFRPLDNEVFELGIEYPHSFFGYVGQAPRSDPIVWTGDLVARHETGIEFKGRDGHAIKTKTGESWLFPERVEAWIREHGGVSDAAVRPLPDHSGLWCVVSSPSIPATLKSDLCRALGPEYAELKIYAGIVSRTPSGKLAVMRPSHPDTGTAIS
ncbi:MAG: AMP-binding protein [Hyphomicrobiaceae bacterium]